MLGSDADLDELFVELYQRMKQERGYTQGEINRKQLSLEGRLVGNVLSLVEK